MNRSDRRRQLATQPKAPDVNARLAADMRVATELHKRGQVREAADLYRRIARVYEGHPELRVVYSNLGAALQGLGKLDDAVAALKKARALKPDSPAAQHNLGMALVQQGKVGEGIDCLARAVELAPDFHDAWVALGIACDQAGDMDRAQDACRRALATDPNSLRARFNLAGLLRRAGKPAEAMAELERCLAIEPRFGEAHYTIGRIHEEAGELGAACDRYLQALRLLPQAEPMHNQLSQVLRRLMATEPERSRALAESWKAEFPDSAIARHMAPAILSGEAGAPERADDAFVKAQFDGFAEVYDETLAAIGNRGPALLAAALEAALPAPDGVLEVLDAGCGTGLLGPTLRPYARTLEGVDLSAGMLGRARARGQYDRLEEAEVTAWLAARPEGYDLVVAGDVLPYFGDLAALLDAAAAALRPNGTLGFTAEALGDGAFALSPSGRYAHGERYVRERLAGAGLDVVSLAEDTLRNEGETPVRGFVVVARRG